MREKVWRKKKKEGGIREINEGGTEREEKSEMKTKCGEIEKILSAQGLNKHIRIYKQSLHKWHMN